ncbi:MAG: HypC/HybG/HupF family hydrogenase formation chaperone [Saprospiraceae bacterium]|nr:HypC/HybG/HupF family hydrogenase formation chaperone [Saprospiraceae bacterium]
MCRAIPGKIVEITSQLDETFTTAKASFGGILKEINLYMTPDANEGDLVLVYVGVAISKGDEEEANKIFSYLKEMGEVEVLNSCFVLILSNEIFK